MIVIAVVLAFVYIFSLFLLFLYGINSYILIWLYIRNKKGQHERDQEIIERFWRSKKTQDLPVVTIQLPIYNEKYVIRRLIEAVTRIEYPKELLEIQVLDDSTDDTVHIAREIVEKYRREGFDISYIHRTNRSGYKAGALKNGLEKARGEFVAIFDADFVPGKEFLRDTIPFFEDPRIAMVQTRWGHINWDYSLLTLGQSIGIDGHFAVEQAGRVWSGLFMNFNGTAGIWRKLAIYDAGGWQADTLTEDLDLSYRALLRGWKMKFLQRTVSPAELPVQINAFKSQQHRWAKGSIQTAKKNIPRILKAQVPWFTKYQAVLHLTHYLVHPLMLTVALLSIPLLKISTLFQNFSTVFVIAAFFALATFGPSSLYVFSQRELYKNWYRRICYLPVLMCLGTGIAISNTKAVLEALFNIESSFRRTPKFKVESKADDWRNKSYLPPVDFLMILEFFMGIYCLIGLYLFLSNRGYFIGPFLAIYTGGFLYVSLLTFVHSFSGQNGVLYNLWKTLTQHKGIWLVLLIGFILRFLKVFQGDFSNPQEYGFIPASWMGVPQHLDPDKLWLPLYTIFSIFIDCLISSWSLLTLKLSNIFLSLIIIFLVYINSKNWKSGLIASLILSLTPMDILASSMSIREPLMTFFLLVALTLFLKNEQVFLPSIFLGLASLTGYEAWIFSLFFLGYFSLATLKNRLLASYKKLRYQNLTEKELFTLQRILWLSLPSLLIMIIGLWGNRSRFLEAGGMAPGVWSPFLVPDFWFSVISWRYWNPSRWFQAFSFMKLILISALPLFVGWILTYKNSRNNPIWNFTLVYFLLFVLCIGLGLFSENYRYIYLILPLIAMYAGEYWSRHHKLVILIVLITMLGSCWYYFHILERFADLNFYFYRTVNYSLGL
ncbi:MAG TPA: glycosyltransferase [Candidatus Limnocylindrales bacterium]|nr:glycosyltransferase [Candidatus Limnocylindrales bacterium]